MTLRRAAMQYGGLCRRASCWGMALWVVAVCCGAAICCGVARGQDPPPAPDAPAVPAAEAAEGAPQAQRSGQWIRLSLPIDYNTLTSVQRTVRRVLGKAGDTRPVFILEFAAPAGAEEGGHGTQFGAAYDLAQFLVSDELNAATTVAYIPQTLNGHAVLPVLACEQIIMAEDAALGDAGKDEKAINDTLLSAYRTIATSRRTVPIEIALGMLDKSREVWRVKTAVGTQYVSAADLEAIRQKQTIVEQEKIKPADQPWSVTGREGRVKLRFVKYLAADRREVTKALDLPPDAVLGDPSNDGQWRAIHVRLSGPVNGEKVRQTQQLIADNLAQKDANFVCLEIDSPGGDPAESMQLATFLADLDPNSVRTVAYIRNQALADAALIAMGCDQIVMQPDARLGGSGAHQMSDDEISQNRQTLRAVLAVKKMRSWSLWAAMIDPQLDVYRVTRLGEVAYFSEEELQERQPDAGKGQKGPPWKNTRELVTTPGKALKLSGEKAANYQVAHRLVDDFNEFKEYYGLQNDPSMVEPGWADFLINALRSDGVAILLLFLGGAALYIELHTPGLGLGGFVATVCFALFFWSRYLNGTAGWLQVILFVTGVAFLLLELFVLPGFGVFGLGGGALVLLALVLASQTFFIPRNDYQLAQMQRSLLMVAGAMGGLIVTAIALRHWLPRAPVFNNVFLAPPEGEEAEGISRRESLMDLDRLLGASGIAVTPLTPGGKARFGSHLVDVVADGEFVSRDRPVVVIEVHGNRVVVRPVD